MKLEKYEFIYNGQFIKGEWREQYGFIKGDNVVCADIFINAKNKYNAVNKLRKMLGFEKVDKETIEEDIENGYVEVEEASYYDLEDDELYKYYVCVRYNKEYGM